MKMFKINELDESLDASPVTKRKIEKHTKLLRNLMTLNNSMPRCLPPRQYFRSMGDDEKQMLVYLWDHARELRNTGEAFDDVTEAFFNMYDHDVYFRGIVDIIRLNKEIDDAVRHTTESWYDIKPTFDFDFDVSKIDSTDHPLYACYTLRELQWLKIIIRLVKTDMNLNWIDMSEFTTLSEAFWYSEFNGDISLWDVRNVTDCTAAFSGSMFNGDISKWRFENATYMGYMFAKSQFSGDISEWVFPKACQLQGMFEGNKAFNGDISHWKFGTARNVDMSEMFKDSAFTGDIDGWKAPRVCRCTAMFEGTGRYKSPKWMTDGSCKIIFDVEDESPFHIIENSRPGFI